ncbi:lipopolysaccharide biosynthesis protein [uncultured Enorma sp.]|uniref:lipopolysaccharide biosynthesis protein n=1 Tax=uncultured Enorma sp. TaxID=1714346 RepID=UPI0026DBF235|nr:lipopolysaccharide biosynthesis protein [uncultured Enorma sp.]
MPKSVKSKASPLSIQQNVIWNSLGNFVYLVSQWLLTYVVVRVQGYGPAGIFSLAMSVGNSLNAVATYTMRNYQVSDIEGEYSDRQYILSRYVTSVISFIACLVFCSFNEYSSSTFLCIAFYMIFKISEALSDVYQAIYQRVSRMDYIGKAYIAKAILSFCFFFGVLCVTSNLLAAIVALCCASYIVVIFYERREVGSFALHPAMALSFDQDMRQVKKLLLVCLPVALYGLFFNTMGQVPRYVLELLKDDDALGVYTSVAMPVTLVQVSANYLFAPLTAPLASCFTRHDVRGFYRLFWKAIGAIAIISIAAFVGFGIAGKPVMILLFGESIEPHLYLLNPLIFCSVLVALSWFLSAALTVVRKLVAQLVLSVVSFSISCVTSFLFINVFGMNGVTFSYIAALLVFAVGGFCILLSSIKGEK